MGVEDKGRWMEWIYEESNKGRGGRWREEVEAVRSRVEKV